MLEEEKTVGWHSAAKGLEKETVPREFTTTSKVIIITNDWKTLNKNVAALQDRGHVLVFEPTVEKVHVGGYFSENFGNQSSPVHAQAI